MAEKDKNKDGVSMREIEGFARRYAYEGFSALAIVIATISAIFDFFSGSGWSLLFCGVAAAVTLFFYQKIKETLHKFYGFITKQEKSTLIIIGVVRLIIALFLPFVIFASLGFLAGISYVDMSRNAASKMSDQKREGSSSEDKDHF